MKHIALSLLIVSQFALADCDIRSASALTSNRSVGPVLNLERIITKNTCTVRYSIQVNGDMHEVEETKTGEMSDGELCRLAIDSGRKDLLTSLGGNFRADSVTVCQTNKPIERRIQIGDTILESEVGTSTVTKSFKHKGAQCRMFTERLAVNGKLKVYNGVICQVDNSTTDWLVVDKW
jgi:hypothetical protein